MEKCPLCENEILGKIDFSIKCPGTTQFFVNGNYRNGFENIDFSFCESCYDKILRFFYKESKINEIDRHPSYEPWDC